jgi:hypothetical protein
VDGYGVGFTQMDDHTDRSGLRDGSRLRNSVNAAYMLKELAGARIDAAQSAGAAMLSALICHRAKALGRAGPEARRPLRH